MTRSRQTADWGSRAGLAKIVPSSVAVGSGTGSANALGTVSFSGASSVSLNDVFSATYDSYIIKFNNCISITSNTHLSLRLRVSGADESSANYFAQQSFAGGTSVSGFRSSSATSWIETIYLQTTPVQNIGTINIYNPFITRVTTAENVTMSSGNSSGIDIASWVRGLNTTTSYTGFTVFPSTGGATITGSVSVYGYTQ